MAKLFEAVEISNLKSPFALEASAQHSSAENILFVNSKASHLVRELADDIAENTIVEFCTAGQFSLHNLVQHLLKITGPADVFLSSWTIKEDPARMLFALKKSGQIKTLSCIFDHRVKTMDAKHFSFIAGFCDQYVLTKIHAKVVVLEGDNCSIVVISSANFSKNPRIEAGTIIRNEISPKFHKKWMLRILNGERVA